MEQSQIRQEISIVKEMIEKTRRETAESGYFFIFIGIICSISPVVIGMLEQYNLNNMVLPALIILTIISGVIGYLVISREERNEKVKSYPKTVFYQLWFACGMTMLIMVFLFPFLKSYPWPAVPILVSLVCGIGLYLTGVIYELRFIQWFSTAWRAGACLMAVTEQGMPRAYIMSAIIIVGWVLPGLILNKQYKKRSAENGS
jgi:hypothetical protein